MELLNFLLGAGLSLGLSLLPNMNSLVITVLAAPLGNSGVLAALIMSLFVNTLKEIYYPRSSGNILISSISSEVEYLLNRTNKQTFTTAILKTKLYTAIVGLIIGVIVGSFSLGLLAPAGFSLWSLLLAVSAILVSIWFTELKQLQDNWVSILIFLASTSIWVSLSSLVNLSHPILLFSCCVFFIPLSINFDSNNSHTNTTNTDDLVAITPSPRWTILPFCLLGSSAGINFNLFNSLFNPPGLAFVNQFAFETFIEFVAIGRLIAGVNASGTAAAGSVLANASLPLACIAIYFAWWFTNKLNYSNFPQQINSNLFQSLGLFSAVFITTLFSGFWSLFLIPIGLALHPHISKVPLQFKGLLFLGVVL